MKPVNDNFIENKPYLDPIAISISIINLEFGLFGMFLVFMHPLDLYHINLGTGPWVQVSFTINGFSQRVEVSLDIMVGFGRPAEK